MGANGCAISAISSPDCAAPKSTQTSARSPTPSVSVRRGVHQDPLAHKAHHPIHHELHVDELVTAVEGSVLNRQRQIERPGWKFQRILFVVAHQQEPREAAIDLNSRSLVRVGVEPVGAGAVVDDEFINIAFAGADCVHGMTVHPLHDVKPMPVHDRRLGETIGE
jgi:hypothetical protein